MFQLTPRSLQDLQRSSYKIRNTTQGGSMTKRFVPGFFSGIAVGVIIAGLALSVVATQGAQAPQGGQPAQPAAVAAGGRGQRGPATPPAPCGPNIAAPLG